MNINSRKKYTVEKREGVLVVTFIQTDFSTNEYSMFLEDFKNILKEIDFTPVIFDLRKSTFLSSENRDLQVDWNIENENLLKEKIHSFCYIVSNVMVQMILNAIVHRTNLSIPSYTVKNMAQAVHKTTVAS